MNKDQFIYDLEVQVANRADGIKILEDKLIRLQKLRADIYSYGQSDKVRNHRENTLLEYRNQVVECDKKIQQAADLHTTLKRRNGLLKPKLRRKKTHSSASQPSQPQALMPLMPLMPSMSDSELMKSKIKKRIHRNVTPRYPISMTEMAAVLQTLVEQGDLDPLRPDIREWIIRFYSDELRSVDKMQETMDSLSIEIDNTHEQIKKEKDRGCC